ncbi:GSCFA domain-containing protein [Rhizobium puerariae]|uniref:GSCFA domain-containing protein n=1 Tax=Rhizobium puerariae TaxID=1585791 RepID=A0ABV6ARG9_9HYPH
MSQHPYKNLPQHTRWSRSVASVDMQDVDPVGTFPFRLTRSDRVATAGSCFAQHIARRLKASGYTYYVVEDGHPLGSEELKAEFGYGTYSARYANIYTARQLVQLFQRAFSQFSPLEDTWHDATNDAFVDPLRPAIQPGGFSSREEMQADRRQHLLAVRKMFETLDYFVFTLGLTETWIDRRDGTVFPVCPGVAGGNFDPSVFEFRNFSALEVISDLNWFLHELRRVNPAAKVIFTVSPVPLAATARADTHVLTATTYSKSVLRVAAEEIAQIHGNVAYFPSYEIITGSFSRGSYFAEDLRSVREEGVDHVMKLFFKHATEESDLASEPSQQEEQRPDPFLEKMSNVVAVLCEEELIEKSMAS